MIMQIHTEKELIEMVGTLKKEVSILRTQNSSSLKKIELMQLEIDKKPNVEVKETVIQIDPSVLPTLKKISDRLKTLEDKKPGKQIIKEVTIKEVKPVVNNVTTGLDDNQVLELLNKHVTMNYINKLYKKG